jgi:hypothetical protein
MGGVLCASSILGKNLLAKLVSSPPRIEEAFDGDEGSSVDRMPSAA